MIDIEALFETHLTVADLQRSMFFFGGALGLTFAEVFWDRKVAFYWVGERGGSMLGLWEVGNSPQRLSLHPAFRTSVPNILKAPALLRSASIEPLEFHQQPTENPWFFCGRPLLALLL